LVSLIILGVSSLFALYVTYKNTTLAKTASLITLTLSLVSFALVAQTGYLGGQIRHTEISTGVVQNNNGQDKDDD
jgi:uncharacterized membrane protein